MTGADRPDLWVVESARGRAGDLLSRSMEEVSGPDPVRRTARVLDVTAPTLVLGSGQPDRDVDRVATVDRRVDVVRRRSGGGAVLLTAEQVLWVDLILPADDRRWDADVGRGAWWVGEAWAAAIESVGVDGATVWRGGLQRTEWSDRVCFAGLGPGEVVLGDRKVVGVAQRRTRAGVLFQTAVLLRWDPAAILGLLDLPDRERARALEAIGPRATGVGPGRREALRTAFLGTLMQ